MSESGKVAERLAFIELDPASLARVASLKPLIDRHIERALARFYDKLRTVPAVSRFFSGPEQVAHAKGKQANHWSGIAAGHLDNGYFDRANVIGNVHARIGLEPKWYIGGYGLILETLVEGVMKDLVEERLGKAGFAGRVSRGEANAAVNDGAHALTAMLKAVMLDIDIAVSTYFERTMDETRELNRQIGDVVRRADAGDFGGRIEVKSTNPEILQLATQLNGLMGAIDNGLAATKDAIHSFAKADLTGRMSGDYRGAFADLQRDIDEMGGQLTAVVDTIRGCSQSLTTANTEILSGSNDLAERTTRQAAAIEQTTAAMEQLSHTVAQNSERAREASKTSDAVAHAAVGAGEVIAAANGAMDRISTSSSKISNIIGMIDDIAFQTNLLALNASVEAARAGDAGKGFAVVAVEVRRLAQSAAGASAEVKTLIEQSSTEVTSGTRLVGEAVARIEKMQETIRTSRDLVLAIAEETTAQAGTINEVASAIRTLDEMTQHNAALVEETNAAIEQTEQQTEELSKAVRVFTTSSAQADYGARRRRAAA